MKENFVDNGVKDISVEMLRVLGMIIVVGVHIKLPNYVGGSLDMGRVFISCLMADGVAVFWMILGFFLLDAKKDYITLVKKSVVRILLPLALYSAFIWFFSDFIIEGTSLADSVSHSREEYRVLFLEGILEFKNIQVLGGHMWYLYVYFAVILLQPALKGLKETMNSVFKRKWMILLIFFLVLLINDITMNGLLEITHLIANGVIGAGIFVIAGAILYENKEKVVHNYKYGLVGITLFLLSNIVRTFVVRCCYEVYNTNHPEAWYTSFGFLVVISLFLIFYGFSGYIHLAQAVRTVVCHMGKITFYIYIVHMLVVKYLTNCGVCEKIQLYCGNTWWGDILYMFCFELIVLAIAWIISEVLYVSVWGIRKIIPKD